MYEDERKNKQTKERRGTRKGLYLLYNILVLFEMFIVIKVNE